MDIGDLKDIEKPNIFHIRFLYYLMMKYPYKPISIYVIADYYKKGNANEYAKAKRELKEAGYLLDLPEGISLNPEKEQFKLFIKGFEKDPSITFKLKKYEKEYMESLTNKHTAEFFKGEYKRYKSLKK